MPVLLSRRAFFATALLAVTCLPALTGCSGDIRVIPDKFRDTGIQGQVRSGPLFPTAQQGQTNDAPLSGAVITVLASNGSEAARGMSDNSGNYKIFLVPGTYQVQGLPYHRYSTFPSPPAPQTVVVPGHQIVTVNLAYDTGIR